MSHSPPRPAAGLAGPPLALTARPDVGLVGRPVPPADPRRRIAGDPIFRRFTFAQVCGQAGDAMTTLALAQLIVFDLGEGASPAALARALIATAIPLLVAGPLAGVAADRWRRRRTLSIASGLRAVVTLGAFAVPMTERPIIGYAVAAALILLARILYAARVASLPHVVEPDDLVAADSLAVLSGMVAGAVGTSAAVGLMTISPTWTLTVAIVLHAIAANGFRRLPDLGGGGPSRSDSPGRPTRLRIGTATSSRARRAIAATGFHRFLMGGAFATSVFFGEARYHLESSGYAVALGIMAFGGFLGSIVAPWIARRSSQRHITAGAYWAAGGLLILAGWLPTTASVAIAMMGAALACQNLRLVTDALIQTEVADQALGRVFAAYDIVNQLAFTAGALIVVATTRTGAVSLLLVIGSTMATIGLAISPFIGGTRPGRAPGRQR